MLLLVFAQVTAAEVYRQPDRGDGVEFSDQDAHTAERVTVPPPQTFSTPHPVNAPTPEASVRSTPDRPLGYLSVIVAEPANEATVRDNNGEVEVSLELTPPLQVRFAHRVQLKLDGSPHGAPGHERHFVLSGVDRGTHTLQAVVLAADGKPVWISPISVFHLHRKIIPRRKPPPKK